MFQYFNFTTSLPVRYCPYGQGHLLNIFNMGDLQQLAETAFDVETVLSQLTQNEKIALLSGEISINPTNFMW